MSLEGKSSEEIDALEMEMLEKIPDNGVSIGNKSLREALGWENIFYLSVRKRLLDNGRISVGKGRGGSVFKNSVIDVDSNVENSDFESPSDFEEKYSDERSLYNDLYMVIKERWVQEQPFDQVIVEKTDSGGRRKDGVWTRPDITVAAMTSYTFVPGRHFDIITFEIKHYNSLDVTAVYEALAHRRAATRAYVLAYVPDDKQEVFRKSLLEDILDEASKHGIGVVIAENPEDFDTWEVVEDAIRVTPDPAKLNSFIRQQLNEGSRDQIVRWFRI